MKKAGRISIPIVVLVLIIIAGGTLLFLAGTSPSAVADEFMIALAKGRPKDLARLSYMEGLSEDQEEAAWAKTVDRAQFFRFAFRIKSSVQASPTSATVTMDYFKNADSQGSYVETYTLPIVKVEDKWKVDVRQISRDMFPALPR